jgi:hypothetical protein
VGLISSIIANSSPVTVTVDGTSGSWSQGSDTCIRRGAFLPSVRSASENESLRELIVNYGASFGFLGLTRSVTGSLIFSWQDGNVLTVTNWAENEPSLSGGDCVVMRNDGLWEVRECTVVVRNVLNICQYSTG